MTKWIDTELLDRKVILKQAAAGEHLPEYAVEKDWWVSMTLKALFQTSWKDYLKFKGLCIATHKSLNMNGQPERTKDSNRENALMVFSNKDASLM